jgi:hypothetical protein
MAQPSITINGQEIPWAFIMKVRRVFGGDWDRTIDAFWKARKAEGKNAVVKYISHGLKPDAKNNCYTMLPSKEREGGEKTFAAVRKWWNEEIYHRKRQPSSSGDILRDILMGGAR